MLPVQGMSKPQSIDRLALIREALRILDGEAPEELVVEGDGWSLVDPESVRRDSALAATTVADVPDPPGRAPAVAEGSEVSSLLSAMHDALDAAMAEGWTLADESETRVVEVEQGWGIAADEGSVTAQDQPLGDTDDERAFFVAGEALAAADGEYDDNSPAFWRRFWAKSA